MVIVVSLGRSMVIIREGFCSGNDKKGNHKERGNIDIVFENINGNAFKCFHAILLSFRFTFVWIILDNNFMGNFLIREKETSRW